MWQDFLDRLTELNELVKQHGKKFVILLVIVVIGFAGKCGYDFTPYAKTSKSKLRMNTIGTALESFKQQSSIYPITPNFKSESPELLSAFINDQKYYFSDYTILSSSLRGTDFQKVGRDPYGRKKAVFNYEVCKNEDIELEWIITSVGPDRLPNINLSEFKGTKSLLENQIDNFYDPTNGLFSKGDIVLTQKMFKQNR